MAAQCSAAQPERGVVTTLYYRKEYVEARQWFDTDENREEFSAWFEAHDCVFETRGPLAVLGRFVTLYAEPGDWIVLGEDGDGEYFYSLRPDRFAAQYSAEVLL
jgi:hypothetical protein